MKPDLYCWNCKKSLPPEFFAKDRSRKTGRQNICRACDSAKFQRWYSENRDRILEKAKGRDRRRKIKVLLVAGELHYLSSLIEGKSPLRAFYDLTERLNASEETTYEQN